MQDELFFQYSALECGGTILERWNVDRRVIDALENIMNSHYHATHRYMENINANLLHLYFFVLVSLTETLFMTKNAL